jgi:N-acetylglucosamine kinase-like BadF-type ATPase
MKMSDQNFVLLAADSGGSKTDWRFLTPGGTCIRHIVTGGMASLHPGMLPVAEYARAAKMALPDADIRHIYFSLGGPNVEEIRETLAACWRDVPVTVEREASGDLVFSCRKFLDCSAVVMGGTGVTAMGFFPDNSRRFAEGWGPVFGDLGSGGGIGLLAVQKFLRGVDGTGNSGRLAELFANELKGLDLTAFSGRMELKNRINRLDRKDLAEKAPTVCRLAESGDDAALSIIKESALNMARLAAAVAPENGKILMLGGLFRLGGFYREMCVEYLAELRPECQWLWDEKISIGVMASAKVLQLYGMEIDNELWEKLKNV